MEFSDLSIVVVEPSRTQGRIIGQNLLAEGVAHYKWFSSGEAALSALPRLLPDLVVSALYLPDMTGVELVHAIRKNKRFEQVMFMLISSETDEQALDPIRQAGVVAILPKPFEPKDLHRALAATMDFVEPETQENDDFFADLRVLLVDDSNISRSMLRRILNGLGIENIVEATNGSEAVTELESGYFDLVITDFNMPEMDGQALVRYVRSSDTLSSIPVLMVTGEHDEQRLAAVHQEGVSAVCDKPFQPASFSALLRTLIE